MKNCFISSLYYSPVKSLSFEQTNSCYIKKNIGIVNDRSFAFSRNISIEDAKIAEQIPEKRNLHNFLSLKNTPLLNKYNFSFIDQKITLSIKNKKIFTIHVKNKNILQNFSHKFKKLESSIGDPIYLLKNNINPFFDSIPMNTISLINLNSLNDFSNKISIIIEKERFRGNIYISGLPPWEEFKYIGKRICINNVIFEVIKKIPRCSATNLKPNTDIVTINLPMELKKIYNHIDLGIYLKPISDGFIKVNDELKFNE